MQRLRQYDRRVIVILLIVLVQMVGASLVFPILPLYATERFNMSFTTVTFLNSVFFLAQFLAGPYIGRLSDKYGRVPVLIVSQIGTVISFIILGFADSVAVLFFARFLDGVTGGNIIVAQAYITDITPPEERTKALGDIFAVFGLGFIFGPALGGLLATYFGYTIPFLLAAFAAAVVVILTWRLLDESLSPDQRIQNRQKGAKSLKIIGVLKNMPLMALLGIAFGASVAFSMLQSTYALFGREVIFVDTPDMVQLGVGLLLGVIGLGMLVTQTVILPKALKYFREGHLIVIGGIMRGLALISLAFFFHPLLAALLLAIFSVGLGIQMPSLQTLSTRAVDDSVRGGVLGFYQSSLNLGIIGGSMISGALFERSPVFPFIVGGLLFLIMTIPSIFLVKRFKQKDAALTESS